MTIFQPRRLLLLSMMAGSIGCSSLETLVDEAPHLPRPYAATRDPASILNSCGMVALVFPPLLPVAMSAGVAGVAAIAVIETLILPFTLYSVLCGANSEAGFRKWLERKNAASREDGQSLVGATVP